MAEGGFHAFQNASSGCGEYHEQLSLSAVRRYASACRHCMADDFNPELLLADEPTSALDVTTQAQIVRQMMELRVILEQALSLLRLILVWQLIWQIS